MCEKFSNNNAIYLNLRSEFFVDCKTYDLIEIFMGFYPGGNANVYNFVNLI